MEGDDSKNEEKRPYPFMTQVINVVYRYSRH
uniref:Uncharacterized protein n=1 Tax=Rhizophora mucronata TaxID=61149 RepID=A0A2P2PFK0_RHIMU